MGWNYVTKLIIPYFRNSIRDVVSGFTVKNIYTETGRKEIANRVNKFLTETLEKEGITIVYITHRSVLGCFRNFQNRIDGGI